jgi:hypothetical protein
VALLPRRRFLPGEFQLHFRRGTQPQPSGMQSKPAWESFPHGEDERPRRRYSGAAVNGGRSSFPARAPETAREGACAPCGRAVGADLPGAGITA